MGLSIYANIDAVSLMTARVQSSTDLRPKNFKQLAAGDRTVVDVYLTGQDGLMNIQDYPTRRLGYGQLNARPTGGTFDLGSQTGLAFDITAAALETAIEAEVAACTITELASFVFKVKFDANGAQTLPSVDASNLTPASTVNIQRLVEGDASTQEQWLIRIFQNPIALIDSTWTDIAGNGVRGALNLGTEGIYDLLGNQTIVESTIELELTDADGDVQTIFQVPITITGEVIGQGVTGVAEFDSYATRSLLVDATTRSNYIIVSAADGSDTSGLREREDLPFATPSAALAVATANDVIVVRDGNFSNDEVTLPDSVTVAVNPSAIGPICSTTATRQSILIGAFSGLVHESTGTTTLGAVDMNFIDIKGTSGNVSITNSKIAARDIETRNAVQITGGCSVKIDNCRITSEDAGEAAIKVSTFTGSVLLSDCEVKSSAATGTFAADALEIVSTLTGSIQIKDCTFIGTSTGTYLAEAIKGDTACTVQIQGSLNSNVDVSSTVTLSGGIFNTDSNFNI